ncbi:hypothetical protein BG015_009441 [Linnemannia schmuckeri]|uniref:BTB domain-containing protein n=1 Tax=Linnemannia schmuckeri TaxID=64567 RepID=A0A9P5RXP2_9FUNG|nr:hypothetical protein BG015_009441 [Linnemannia schmuckeri]
MSYTSPFKPSSFTFSTSSAAPSGSPFAPVSGSPFTATSASPFASASAVPTTSPFASSTSPFAPAPTASSFAPSSAFAPFTPTTTFDTTLYGTPKIHELTLPVKSRYSFVERTTLLSTATQARTDGSSTWFIKVNFSQQQAGSLPISAMQVKGGQLEIEVSWHNGQVFSKDKTTSSPTDLDIRQYKSMTFIPKKDPSRFVTFPIAEKDLLDGKVIKGTIDLDKVSTDTHAFEFHIVLSTAPTVARAPLSPSPKNHDILPRFLKDPYSVDICFVFPNDRNAADVGLWAHRVVLSQSKVFAKMIDDAVQRTASDAATVGLSLAQRKAVNDAVAKVITTGEAHENVDEGKMTRILSNHEDETGSVTSFTDIGSQADDSAGDLSFSESETPDLSKLECELGAVEGSTTTTTIKNETTESQESATAEKSADSTTEATATAEATKSDKETIGTTPGAGPRTLTFVIDQVSSAVFLVLLQYIYTGETNLAPSAERFTFSSTKSNNTDSDDRTVSDAVSQQDRETAQWLPSALMTRVFGQPVKYEDLMLAADLYGIDDLAALCQQKVELSLNSRNVARILFDVAPRYPRIKAPALAYMVKSRATMFTKDADPFKDYRNHPDCYNLMLEVVQLLATNK